MRLVIKEKDILFAEGSDLTMKEKTQPYFDELFAARHHFEQVGFNQSSIVLEGGRNAILWLETSRTRCFSLEPGAWLESKGRFHMGRFHNMHYFLDDTMPENRLEISVISNGICRIVALNIINN